MRVRAICLAFCCAAASSAVWSATIHSLDVTKKRGRYELVADTFMDAPADAIFDVLVDYERFNRISSVYKEHGYLEPAADGTPIVYTRMEGCLMRGFFCKSMLRVERLETDEPRYIRTVTLPEQSDFRYATSEWVLEPQDDGTKVTYRLVMEPDFWVPPVIGPWFLKRTLMSGGTRAVNRIERLANGFEPEIRRREASSSACGSDFSRDEPCRAAAPPHVGAASAATNPAAPPVPDRSR